MLDDRTLRAARPALLRWYRQHRRDLPWRRSHDPYAIWVAEIMLQQTRVDVVVPYYERFLALYPSVARLAASPLDAVLRSWSGLGYYSRARSLHAAAQRVVREHAGVLPDDVAALRALPGIGRYTAGAIASVAFDQPAPIVDGNVTRVFTRLTALRADVGVAATRAALWDLATRWAHGPTPGDANQALMELGATVCTPATPQCTVCPLSRSCRAHRLGIAATLPHQRRPARGAVVHLAAALLRDGAHLLLVRRRSGRLLRDWWELPTCTTDGRDGETALREALRQRGGIEPRALRRRAPQVRHGILSHRLEVVVYTGQATATRGTRRARAPHPPAPGTVNRSARHAAPATPIANLELAVLEWRWVRVAAGAMLPLTTLSRKVLRAAATWDSARQEDPHQDVGERRTHERRRHPAQDDV